MRPARPGGPINTGVLPFDPSRYVSSDILVADASMNDVTIGDVSLFGSAVIDSCVVPNIPLAPTYHPGYHDASVHFAASDTSVNARRQQHVRGMPQNLQRTHSGGRVTSEQPASAAGRYPTEYVAHFYGRDPIMASLPVAAARVRLLDAPTIPDPSHSFGSPAVHREPRTPAPSHPPPPPVAARVTPSSADGWDRGVLVVAPPRRRAGGQRAGAGATRPPRIARSEGSDTYVPHCSPLPQPHPHPLPKEIGESSHPSRGGAPVGAPLGSPAGPTAGAFSGDRVRTDPPRSPSRGVDGGAVDATSLPPRTPYRNPLARNTSRDVDGTSPTDPTRRRPPGYSEAEAAAPLAAVVDSLHRPGESDPLTVPVGDQHGSHSVHGAALPGLSPLDATAVRHMDAPPPTEGGLSRAHATAAGGEVHDARTGANAVRHSPSDEARGRFRDADLVPPRSNAHVGTRDDTPSPSATPPRANRPARPQARRHAATAAAAAAAVAQAASAPLTRPTAADLAWRPGSRVEARLRARALRSASAALRGGEADQGEQPVRRQGHLARPRDRTRTSNGADVGVGGQATPLGSTAPTGRRRRAVGAMVTTRPAEPAADAPPLPATPSPTVRPAPAHADRVDAAARPRGPRAAGPRADAPEAGGLPMAAGGGRCGPTRYAAHGDAYDGTAPSRSPRPLDAGYGSSVARPPAAAPGSGHPVGPFGYAAGPRYRGGAMYGAVGRSEDEASYGVPDGLSDDGADGAGLRIRYGRAEHPLSSYANSGRAGGRFPSSSTAWRSRPAYVSTTSRPYAPHPPRVGGGDDRARPWRRSPMRPARRPTDSRRALTRGSDTGRRAAHSRSHRERSLDPSSTAASERRVRRADPRPRARGPTRVGRSRRKVGAARAAGGRPAHSSRAQRRTRRASRSDSDSDTDSAGDSDDESRSHLRSSSSDNGGGVIAQSASALYISRDRMDAHHRILAGIEQAAPTLVWVAARGLASWTWRDGGANRSGPHQDSRLTSPPYHHAVPAGAYSPYGGPGGAHYAESRGAHMYGGSFYVGSAAPTRPPADTLRGSMYPNASFDQSAAGVWAAGAELDTSVELGWRADEATWVLPQQLPSVYQPTSYETVHTAPARAPLPAAPISAPRPPSDVYYGYDEGPYPRHTLGEAAAPGAAHHPPYPHASSYRALHALDGVSSISRQASPSRANHGHIDAHSARHGAHAYIDFHQPPNSCYRPHESRPASEPPLTPLRPVHGAAPVGALGDDVFYARLGSQYGAAPDPTAVTPSPPRSRAATELTAQPSATPTATGPLPWAALVSGDALLPSCGRSRTASAGAPKPMAGPGIYTHGPATVLYGTLQASLMARISDHAATAPTATSSAVAASAAADVMTRDEMASCGNGGCSVAPPVTHVDRTHITRADGSGTFRIAYCDPPDPRGDSADGGVLDLAMVQVPPPSHPATPPRRPQLVPDTWPSSPATSEPLRGRARVSLDVPAHELAHDGRCPPPMPHSQRSGALGTDDNPISGSGSPADASVVYRHASLGHSDAPAMLRNAPRGDAGADGAPFAALHSAPRDPVDSAAPATAHTPVASVSADGAALAAGACPPVVARGVPHLWTGLMGTLAPLGGALVAHFDARTVPSAARSVTGDRVPSPTTTFRYGAEHFVRGSDSSGAFYGTVPPSSIDVVNDAGARLSPATFPVAPLGAFVGAFGRGSAADLGASHSAASEPVAGPGAGGLASGIDRFTGVYASSHASTYERSPHRGPALPLCDTVRPYDPALYHPASAVGTLAPPHHDTSEGHTTGAVPAGTAAPHSPLAASGGGISRRARSGGAAHGAHPQVPARSPTRGRGGVGGIAAPPPLASLTAEPAPQGVGGAPSVPPAQSRSAATPRHSRVRGPKNKSVGQPHTISASAAPPRGVHHPLGAAGGDGYAEGAADGAVGVSAAPLGNTGRNRASHG